MRRIANKAHLHKPINPKGTIYGTDSRMVEKVVYIVAVTGTSVLRNTGPGEERNGWTGRGKKWVRSVAQFNQDEIV
jgi:hypothetical protein